MSEEVNEDEAGTTRIPEGKTQETGFTRFVKIDDVNPDLIKDARINNLNDNSAGNIDAIEKDTVYNSFIHPNEVGAIDNEKKDDESNDLHQAIDDQEKI